MIVAAVAAALIGSGARIVSAQSTELEMMLMQTSDTRPEALEPLGSVSVESFYTAPGRAKTKNSDYGDSDTSKLNISLDGRMPLSEKWFIPLDLRLNNLYLGSQSGAPVPDAIHTLSIGAGVGYRPTERLTLMAKVTPTLYKLNGVDSHDIGLSYGLMAKYKYDYSPSLKILSGLMYSPGSRFNLLPVVGVDWDINDRFNLQLMFPIPRLTYTPNKLWKFHVGAELNEVMFRTGNSFGSDTSLSRYNDTLGSYSEIKAGAGLSYQISRSISAGLDAGYSINRQITYTNINERVDLGSAPYVGIGLRMSF